MKLEFGFGTGVQTVEVPDRNLIGELHANKVPAGLTGDAEVRRALAAPIGTFLCYLVTMLCNFFFVAKKISFIPKISKIFIKPFVSAVACALTAFAVYNYLPVSASMIRTVLAIAAAAVVYFILIFLTKALEKEDIYLLPKGDKIYKVLKKLKFV